MEYPTISYDAIDAIVGGYHGDPFSILGPHDFEDGVVARAFLPLAQTASVVLDDGLSYPMTRIKEDGFFEVFLPGRSLPLAYRVQMLTYGGDTLLYEDPYAFPSTMSDFDAHLLAEGTHMFMYERLGAHLMEIEGRFRACYSPCGRQMPNVSAWSAILTSGTAVAIPCAFTPTTGFGNSSSPALAKACSINTRSRRIIRAIWSAKRTRSAFSAKCGQRTPPLSGISTNMSGRMQIGWQSRAGTPGDRCPDQYLRGPSGIVASQERLGMADLPGSWPRNWFPTSKNWAIPILNCCP